MPNSLAASSILKVSLSSIRFPLFPIGVIDCYHLLWYSICGSLSSDFRYTWRNNMTTLDKYWQMVYTLGVKEKADSKEESVK